MKLQTATLVLSVFLQSASASASVTSAHAAQSSQPVASTNATCPYRTINYITHGLPQQCLTSSWRSTTSPALSNATDSVATLDTPSASQDAVTGSESGSSSHASVSTVTQPEPPAEITTESPPSSAPHSTDPSSSSVSILPSNEPEEPSPLEGDKFMSFEEWKKQNLQKVGQSEHIGRNKADTQAQRKRPVSIHTALDSLGDDAEIELDFSGFIPDGPELASTSAVMESGEAEHVQSDLEAASTPGVRSRSRNAGTTSKERYNYANFDCSANIRKFNPEATSTGAVLGENKDSYMLNVCSASNKFLILELCDDISIDTIVLANFEFFSSIFRTFRVSVSDKYPVKIDKWMTIGTFEARNTRDVQSFLVENPIIWARYVRIEFLTHYGSEYYCPVSLVRVHGTTMLEEYKRDAELLLSGEDDESETAGIEAPAEDTQTLEAVAAPILEGKQEQLSRQFEQHSSSLLTLEEASATSISVDPTPLVRVTLNLTTSEADEQPGTSVSPSAESNLFVSPVSAETCSPMVGAVLNGSGSTPKDRGITYVSNTTTNINPQADSSTVAANATDSTTVTNNTSAMTKQSSSKSEASSKGQGVSASKPATNATATERQKSTSSSPTQNHAPAPTMQESFFKSVQKRLQMLEANSSLSLQYIEDQSRALRDAFNKVEQRQLAKTTTFLDYLNTTVLSELRDFRQQYDQLWQSTVIELEMQRERYQQENAAINARLGVLADELIFQKRISILQMVLILICLAVVLFAKGTLNQYLELPVVQRVLARSPSNRWLNFTNLDTPTQSPPVTRQSSLRKRQGILKGHRRMQSEDSIEGSLSPNDIYPSPPTPTSMSYGEQSDPEHLKEEKPQLENPEFDPSTIERPSTSPPILPSEVPSSPELNGVRESQTIDYRLDIGLSSPPSNPEMRPDPSVPRLMLEEATPDRHPKHLTWKLPES